MIACHGELFSLYSTSRRDANYVWVTSVIKNLSKHVLVRVEIISKKLS